ncbi:hypothetical protein GCM10009551_009750 [Nocardiopsis tropica]
MGRGRPPGARTLNPRIKSPLRPGRYAPLYTDNSPTIPKHRLRLRPPGTTGDHPVLQQRSNHRATAPPPEPRIKSVGPVRCPRNQQPDSIKSGTHHTRHETADQAALPVENIGRGRDRHRRLGDLCNHIRLHGEISHVPPVEYQAAYYVRNIREPQFTAQIESPNNPGDSH